MSKRRILAFVFIQSLETGVFASEIVAQVIEPAKLPVSGVIYDVEGTVDNIIKVEVSGHQQMQDLLNILRRGWFNKEQQRWCLGPGARFGVFRVTCSHPKVVRLGDTISGFMFVQATDPPELFEPGVSAGTIVDAVRERVVEATLGRRHVLRVHEGSGWGPVVEANQVLLELGIAIRQNPRAIEDTIVDVHNALKRKTQTNTLRIFGDPLEFPGEQ